MSSDQEDQHAHRLMVLRGKPLVVPAGVDIAKARLLSVQPDPEPKSAGPWVMSGVSNASSAIRSDPEGEEPYLGPEGWVLPSQFRHRSVSRSSMASASSYRSDETPLTPMSTADDAIDQSGLPELSQLDIKQEDPRPLYPIPLRPKRKGNQESWDSALGSDFSGRGRRHAPSESLSGASDYSSVPSLSIDERSQPAVVEPAKDYEPAERRSVKNGASRAAESTAHPAEESDSDETVLSDETVSDKTVSDETVYNETMPHTDAAGMVLNYTLDVVFGLAVDFAAQVPSTCRSIVDNFINDISWAIDKKLGQKQAPGYARAGGLSRIPTSSSASSSATGSSHRSPTRGDDQGKRKARDDGDEDQDSDDERDDEVNKRRDSGPSKRAKLVSVRMSCPFRKKNPLRFNVRDYRLCALTVFTDTAELRRHIQDVHKRPAPAHRCPRCQSQFTANDKLEDHLRSADICSLVETPLGSEGPEDGIDEAIAKALKSKKGRVSDPIEVQWQKIWELLFPGTPVQPYDYCAVMEHFELHEKYRSSLPRLRASLCRIGLGERGLGSLSKILDNHFIDLFEQCNEEGRQKDYRNRQPKAQQTQLRAQRSFSGRAANNKKRDSGVDVGMEDEVVLEGTTRSKPDGLEGGGDDATPPFDPVSDILLFGQLPPLPGEHVGYTDLDSFDGLVPAVFEGDYRGVVFPSSRTDVNPLDRQQHEPGYTAEPGGDDTGHRTTTTNVFGNGAAALPQPEHSFGYQRSQENLAELDEQWGLGPAGLGFGETMTDLNAWVYAQQGSRVAER